MTVGASPARIAMWSGPRNISTALMRSWENRPDTVVVDEPFYAHYLQVTRAPHPMIDEIIAHYGPDWRAAVRRLLAPLPEGVVIFYQKHMAHHLLPDMEGDWMGSLRHCLLIRNPREMLISLAKVLPQPTLRDTGLDVQVRILAGISPMPPVIDARDVLEDPRGMLSRLCAELGVPFDEAMLSWPAGPRESDGIWASHWYAAVRRSTGFAPYVPRDEPLPAGLEPLLEECLPLYERLAAHRLTA